MPIPEKYKTFRKGQTIFKEGQHVSVAYMVKTGKAQVYRVVNNRRVILNTVPPGQFVGELGLITGEPFHATAEAVEYSECIAFDRQLLQSLIIKSPNPVQRIMKSLGERISALEQAVKNQTTNDIFISLCQLLELACDANEARAAAGRSKEALKYSVGYGEFSRMAKNILLVTQAEIDKALDRLNKINIINIRDVKGATYKTDLFGEVSKKAEFLRDRILVITDRKSFMVSAKNLRREMLQEREEPFTEGLENLELERFARRAGVEPDEVLRRIGQGELPSSLIFLPRVAAEAWHEVGPAGASELRQAAGEFNLETVNDIVFVDNGTLQEAFSRIGFRNLAILYSAAGEAAQQKIEDNLSEKMAKVVRGEAATLHVDVAHISNIEHELFMAIRELSA